MVTRQWYKFFSACNEKKFVVVERLIGTLKNKIYKHMIAILKNMYTDKLNDIINKYNNTYYRTIKMKLINVKSSASIGFKFENSDKDANFKVENHMELSKYKNIFVKGYALNWSEEMFF